MNVRKKMTIPIGDWMKNHWSYTCCVIGGMILVLSIQFIVSHSRPTPSSPVLSGAKWVAETEPWGLIEKETVMLDRPAEAFERNEPQREIVWLFAKTSPAELRALIESVGLTASHQAALLDENRWRASTSGIVVIPPLDLVRDMSPEIRQRLYDALARTPENLAQQFPYVFRGSFEEQFAGCKLSPELLRSVAGMIYKKGDVSIFADLPYFQITASPEEFNTLVRQISRVPAVLVRLELNDHSNLQRLKKYWLSPQKSLDAEPLIRSLARVPGGATLNVETLLPPFPQLLLYSYPQSRKDFPPNANCVWSSMNFFNAHPDNRFVDERFTDQVLRSQYHVVSKADALGDIIMLCTPETDGSVRMIHMCVHIVDDVVFTKNGGNNFQPWLLMRLADVQALFPGESRMQTIVFRRNDS